jgi:hypothetical protein
MTGITYVYTHPGFRAIKVGYTSIRSRRLQELARRGWEPYRTLLLATSDLARQTEQAALFEIRHRLHVPQYLTAAQMVNGWTETSSLALITASRVWDVVCEQAGQIQLSPSVGRAPDGRRRNGGTPPRRVAGDTQPLSPLARKQAVLEQTTRKPSEEQS